MPDKIRFYINWQNRTTGMVGMGVSMGDVKHKHIFPNKTPVVDCIDILRAIIVRKAGGLDYSEFMDEHQQPPQPEQDSLI